MESLGYKLVIDDAVKRFVASKGYDVQFGARPLKRSIQNNLEDGLAELILNEDPQAGDTIHVGLNAEGNEIKMEIDKIKQYDKQLKKQTKCQAKFVWHFLSVCHRNLLQTNQNSKKLKYKNYAKR